MCDPVTAGIMFAVGTGVSAGASLLSGAKQKAALEGQADQQKADAAAARGVAQVEADRIRKAAQRKRAAVAGQFAASGVRVDEGSAGDVESFVVREGEMDALTRLITGNYQGNRLEGEAGLSMRAGRNALMGGALNAAGTALGNYGMAYAAGWIPSRSAARVSQPVGLRSAAPY